MLDQTSGESFSLGYWRNKFDCYFGSPRGLGRLRAYNGRGRVPFSFAKTP
jgi:hypothetical protein